MAMNYTKSALLGQNPDMLSAQVDEAKTTYMNALVNIGKARGTTDTGLKSGYINEALTIIEKADNTFSNEIKVNPAVAEIIKKIRAFIEPELKQIQSARAALAERQRAEALKKGITDFKADMSLYAPRGPSDPIVTPPPPMPDETVIPPDDTDAGAAPETKFPILPIAIAAGAIGLAFMIGS